MAYKKKEKEDEYKGWMEELKKLQESDLDQRQQAREADRFLLDKDGQWEDNIRQQLDSQKRPRYTFDKVTPIIESMMADIEDMDFGCNVKPADGASDKDTALTLEGMIRAIQNHSRSDDLFRHACRRIMRRGFDAWLVKSDYMDEWSFEQDLFIKPIPNAINRVWTSNTCTEADSSDSDVSYVLTSLSPDDYKAQFPDGAGISVDDSDIDEHWDQYRPEVITIAERYYPKDTTVEIAQLSSGDVVRLDDKWESIKDEQAAIGITVVKTKEVKEFTWYHCTFDGGGILTEEKPTVFKSNPVVTVYGNFELLGQNSKITYSGIVLKEMDAQRVHNYSKSREVEEGALAPRTKLMMTKANAKGHENQIARMNVSSDPVQFYNPDGEAPPPYQIGGPQINPHLTTLSNQMAVDMKEQAGVFSAMQGDFAGRMSEDTVKMQIDRGTAATRKWVNALIVGIRRTCELLVQAIPETYDTKRQMSIVGIDGTTEDLVTLNDEIWDEQSQKMIKVNNLNAGKYKVVCDAGPAFANKLEAGLDALLKYAEIDPSVIQQGGDIMLKAIDAPLVDQIAERKRAQMLQAGMIPVDQMTDEEKEQMQAQAQQPQEPSPDMLFAQAEMLKAENDKTRLMIDGAKLEQGGQKLSIEEAKAIADIRNKNANTAKTIADTEKVSGETIGNQIDNIQKLSPNVQ